MEDQEIQAISEEDFREASEKLEEKFQELSRKRDEEIRAGKEQIDRDFRLQLQEARLVTDQLLWLRELSGKLLLNIQKLKQS